jgi:hypothetical protein
MKVSPKRSTQSITKIQSPTLKFDTMWTSKDHIDGQVFFRKDKVHTTRNLLPNGYHTRPIHVIVVRHCRVQGRCIMEFLMIPVSYGKMSMTLFAVPRVDPGASGVMVSAICP